MSTTQTDPPARDQDGPHDQQAAGNHEATPSQDAAASSAAPPNKTQARLASYSVKNMVYSLLAVFALAFAWWALMPNPEEPMRAPADVAPVAAYAAAESDFPVWTPQAVSEQWPANFANFETYAGALTWRVGVVSPQGEYVEIAQTADATPEWVEALTSKADQPAGTRTITGPDGSAQWQASEGEERAVVLEPGPGREATTVVHGTADWPEIEEFIGLLEDASQVQR